jgi:hypothetical protein
MPARQVTAAEHAAIDRVATAERVLDEARRDLAAITEREWHRHRRAHERLRLVSPEAMATAVEVSPRS